MEKTPRKDIPTPKSETIDEDEALWNFRVDTVYFDTDFTTPKDVRGDKAKERAREELVDAVRSGNADIKWDTTVQTKDDLEQKEKMNVRCDRCKHVIRHALNEIDLEERGEFYEADFETGEDSIVMVCDTCKDDMWELAHANENGDEAAAD